MKLSGDARVYIFVLAISLFMVLWSLFGSDYRFESKILPVLIGSVVALLAAAGLWNDLRARRTAHVVAEDAEIVREPWLGYLIHFGWLTGFLLAIYLFGYLLAIPMFLFFYTRRLGSGLLAAMVSALTVTAFIYVSFEFALDVKLYRGLVFMWLG